MTTIIGIKANSGVEGIVLGADRQLTTFDGEKAILKEQIGKITYGKNWIIGDAGGISNQFAVFLQYKNRKMAGLIYRAIQRYYEKPESRKPHFPEINEINTIAKRREEVDENSLHEFILAAKFGNKLGLWQVDYFGNLKESEKDFYLALGSGEDYVAKYLASLSEKGIINNNAITVPKAIGLATKCLEIAEQDPNTSGLDLAVLTNKGVRYFGNFIQETMEKQKRDMVRKIKEKYR
ncbi:hypothetical protein HY494_02675 [Candidatus Woesearchaeota archaeon]|nr:hypothetical protein [Candidatus Woesearchaeota archaeon]